MDEKRRQYIIAKLKELHMNGAHWIDIWIRRNGKDERYEADWLKDILIHLER